MDLREVITGSKQTAAMMGERQDLSHPSSITVTSIAPRAPFWKLVALDAVSVLVAAAFGYAYYAYLTRGLSGWALLGALTLFAAVFAVGVFFGRRGRRAFLVMFLESVAVVGFFWRDDWRVLLVTWLIVLAFLGWGYASGKLRLENSIEVPFFGTSATALGKFTTGILLFMILIYVPQIAGNPLVVSEKSFGTFFDWTSGIVNNFYPEISLNGSFGNFSESVTKMELANNPNFQNLSPDEQSAALAAETQQFEESFPGNASGTVATSTSASDAFYNVLRGMAGAWQSESGGWFVVGWAAVIFIALRSVGVVFNWIAEFVALMLYELLLATGFMKIHEEEHVREVIGL